MPLPPVPDASEERLPLATIGGHRSDQTTACDEVDELITDTGADRATLQALADAGLRTRLVDPQPLRRPAGEAAS